MYGDRRITRRAALVHTARAGAAVAVASQPYASQPDASHAAESVAGPPPYEVWDVHGHLNGPGNTSREKMANLLKTADRMGIDRVVIFMGYPFVDDPSPEEIRRQNDQVLEALVHARGRAFGFVYLNPRYTEASLKEMDRCIRDGPMVGVKLWVAVRCHEQRLDPIVQRAIELKAPVLQHTWSKITGNLRGESTASDLAALATRHPAASFIAAHVGGDWERGIRAIRSATNIAAEICGSDPTAGLVEMAVRELGGQRVIYGSDFAGRSFASQLAKVLGADIPDETRQLILAGNIQKTLRPILTAKGLPR